MKSGLLGCAPEDLRELAFLAFLNAFMQLYKFGQNAVTFKALSTEYGCHSPTREKHLLLSF